MALGICTQQKVLYHPRTPSQGILPSTLLNLCLAASRDTAAVTEKPSYSCFVLALILTYLLIVSCSDCSPLPEPSLPCGVSD